MSCKEIVRLEQEIEIRDEVLADRAECIKAQDEQITTLKGDCACGGAMLGELQKTIETKDITVSVQEDTLAKLEKRVVDLKKERDQWKALTIRTEKRLRDIVSARQKSGWFQGIL